MTLASATTQDSSWDWIWVAIPMLVIFGGAVLEFFGNVLSNLAGFISGWGERKHERELEKKRLELEILKAKNQPQPPAPVKIPKGIPSKNTCRHKRVLPVIAADGQLAAWLCTNPRCEAQLPKGFAVYEDDL
jgi:hypothetical protein